MKVVVGLIFNSKNQVLLTKRPPNVPEGNIWEFPGGKIEINEKPAAALTREVFEEVGLRVKNAEFLGIIDHKYLEQKIYLHTYLVTEFSGKAKICENQVDLRWVDIDKVKKFTMPKANFAMLELLDLY